MNNQEILNRFDVLYNNITSLQAPGLDPYEKSVFWNKATLEVLKNHINPKGNHYAEGFDGSSKRQVEFSNLVVRFDFEFPLDAEPSGYTGTAFVADEWIDNPLFITNERIDVITPDEREVLIYYFDTFLSELFQESGGLPVVHRFIDWLISRNNVNPDTLAKISSALEDLLAVGFANIHDVFDEEPTLEQALKNLAIKPKSLVVVPVNHVEADTLMSRPYKYPSKSQAWRILVNNLPEFVVGPNVVPVAYHSRYIKTPAEVNLESNVGSEVPEILHDEILQRAVELAKNSWEGNVETAKAFGERSE